MIRQRHPDLWQVWKVVFKLPLGDLQWTRRDIFFEVEGFVPPSWMELSLGAPPPREMEDSNLVGVGEVARGSFRKAGGTR